jgi:hypothetical protein
VAGSPSFIIAAADTVMDRPSADLLAEVFPDAPVRSEFGEFGTRLAIDRARQILGYEPRHTWRNHLPLYPGRESVTAPCRADPRCTPPVDLPRLLIRKNAALPPCREGLRERSNATMGRVEAAGAAAASNATAVPNAAAVPAAAAATRAV